MKMIHNIRQLAEHLGVPSCFQGEYDKAIARLVYKYTECGCTFDHDQYGIEVAGYAEGADAECPTHRLEYPFAAETFWLTLEDADEEGCQMWREWNDPAMECPRCKDISLRLVDEEVSDDGRSGLYTYECDHCGHEEVHVEGLPSWYRPEKWEGGQPQETGTEESNDE